MRMIGGGGFDSRGFSVTTGSGNAPGGAPAAGVIFGIADAAIGGSSEGESEVLSTPSTVTVGVDGVGEGGVAVVAAGAAGGGGAAAAGSAAGIPLAGVRRRGTMRAGLFKIAGGAVPMSVLP